MDSLGSWSCCKCTYLNRESLQKCEMCDASRSSDDAATVEVSIIGGQGVSCPFCQCVCSIGSTNCGLCGTQLKKRNGQLSSQSSSQAVGESSKRARRDEGVDTTYSDLSGGEGTSVVSISLVVNASDHPSTENEVGIVTGGIIELVEDYYEQQMAAPVASETSGGPRLSEYALCSPCLHVSQKGWVGAEWSCGYRNIQMLCYSLLGHPTIDYKRRLFNGQGDIPDIHGLQTWIQRAWTEGFDVQGATDYGYCLLGSDEWIGATECAALLRFFGIRAIVVDFASAGAKNNRRNTPASALPASAVSITSSGRISRKTIPGYFAGSASSSSSSSSSGSHFYDSGADDFDAAESGSAGGAGSGSDADLMGRRLAAWVRKYFAHHGRIKASSSRSRSDARQSHGGIGSAGGSPEHSLPLHPLYFQHQGHSRTIIGYETTQTTRKKLPQPAPKTSLLVFDPLSDGNVMKTSLLTQTPKWKQQLKRGSHTFYRGSYQIVYIAGVMSDAERERSKLIVGVPDSEPILDTIP